MYRYVIKTLSIGMLINQWLTMELVLKRERRVIKSIILRSDGAVGSK